MMMRTSTMALCLLFGALSLVKAQNPALMPNFSKDLYEAEWKLIDSLENQGLPQSALELLTPLHQRAVRDNNPAQVIKTIAYTAKYQAQLSEEDTPIRIVRQLRTEEAGAPFPVNLVLRSMIAEFYFNYLQSRYWSLRDRTELEEVNENDPATWPVGKLISESTRYYLASLDDPRLSAVNIDLFDAVTTGGEGVDDLRPTLYDFLAHRAIDHFSNEQTYLNAPAYRFYLDQPEYFAPAAAFAALDISSRDSTSFHLKALTLLQDLIQRHLKDADPKAMLDADLKRLDFVYRNSILPKKEEYYRQALENVIKGYAGHPMSSEACYQLAQWFYNQSSSYAPGKESPERWYRKEALKWCEEGIRRFPGSMGAQSCTELVSAIKKQEFELQTESVSLPDRPTLAFVGYRNTPKLWFKVVKAPDEEELQKIDYQQVQAYYAGLPPIAEWIQAFDLPGDFQSHQSEIEIPALPSGQYLLIGAANQDFSDKSTPLAKVAFDVSRLTAFYQGAYGSDTQIFLLTDRATGNPESGVKAEFFTFRYNRGTGKQERQKLTEAFSDANGFVKVTLGSDVSYKVVFTKGSDTLDPNRSFYSYANNREADLSPTELTHFFLDRQIYRPGQTIYFKAILMRKTPEGIPSVLPGKRVNVSLQDVNGQEIANLALKANDYGTVSGTFQAPTGGLLGRMSLHSDVGNGYQDFGVEEYKRPKFEVTFDTLEQAFALDQDVTVTGQAKAYAGSNIDGAVVRYRVVRQVRFPWAPWWRIPVYAGNTMEITQGETTTDADGKFEILFKAAPDRTLTREQRPAFDFIVYANVIDITGETHSAEKTVKLAYIGLVTGIKAPDSWNREQTLKIELTAQNLDGKDQPVEGAVTIHRLQGPDRPLIGRLWDTPDLPVIPREKFKADFPFMPYQEENQPHNWPKAEQVWSGSVSTGADQSLNLDVSAWPAGHYWIRFSTKTPGGEELVSEQKITVLADNGTTLPPDLLFAPVDLKEAYQPGEELQLNLGRPAVPLHLYYEITRNQANLSQRWINVSSENAIRYRLTEEDRGGLQIFTLVQWQNRVFTDSRFIQVPWNNKELTITYETFRDKLLPGQEEEWRLRISGPEKEKAAAELVAAMYDASLDAFEPNNWTFNHYPIHYDFSTWTQIADGVTYFDWINYPVSRPAPYSGGKHYRSLNWFNISPGYGIYRNFMGDRIVRRSMAMDTSADFETYSSAAMPKSLAPMAPEAVPEQELAAMAGMEQPRDKTGETGAFPVRKNLNETVFFLPHLTTDVNGDVLIKFKMNEALTRWKFLAFAHTKDLRFGLTERTVVTSKDLMVLPNQPRFLREGDRIEWTAKVVNMAENPLAGTARLEILDAASMQPLNKEFGLTQTEVAFKTEAGQSAPVAWNLTIPTGLTSAVVYRVTAQSGEFADGEEAPVPVLTNRMLVTETLPLPLRGKETKTFTLEHLKNNTSTTLQHHGLTLEFTSNPAWYAVQSLPYLMEYPYQCSEQIFNRFYANALAASVVNQHPAIREMFEKWKKEGGMQSPLAANEEIKNVLLTETPWLRDAKSEEEQQKNIALLFDLARMEQEQSATLATLEERQSESGGFSWFPGGPESWYITQYIVEGLGHLKSLGVLKPQETTSADYIAENAVGFIDQALINQYKELEKAVEKGDVKWEDDHLSQVVIHYLYARSFYDYPLTDELEMITGYYLGQASQFWNKRGLYEQALLALSLNRRHKTQDADAIVRSLRERALNNPELGMYWKYDTGWFWYQLPIETHSAMIEVFAEVAKDDQAVDDLKVWLLKNKQTNHWGTTKATAAAVYALLNYGDNWLLPAKPLKIGFPDRNSKAIAGQLAQAQTNAKAGTGYFKTAWTGDEVSAKMATVKVKNPNKSVAWGALYWQYFEDLDKITTFRETPLTLKKSLYIERTGDTGPVLVALRSANDLHPGDKVKVRLELRVDRDMEYVHLKDMRAAGLEPIETESRYKWQGGLGYYESPGDAATNFFFDNLRKGTYIFEYPLRANLRGDFSNGISTIQCMYAPEFSSHSEGQRIKVD